MEAIVSDCKDKRKEPWFVQPRLFFGTEGQTDFNISGLCKEPHY